VQDGFDQELDVVIVEAGECIPEIDGDSLVQARRNAQHPSLDLLTELTMSR
jgi:hypothetical protein